MSLSEDMSRLTAEMRAAYDSRVAAVGALQKETEAQLAATRKAHLEMATAQRQELEAFNAALEKDVAEMLGGFDAAHKAMSAEQQQKLDEFTGNLRKDVADFLKTCDNERQSMSQD
ncbi:MAG: hypothetical protein EOM24_28420, partial [Chloroflexia bacterium]|nr:hypothetical protein [Chloroflexia bacterium]